ncbi:MAG: hypothetical protein K2Q09_02030, partial [Phycisphaerales bacterium]|nr:hypothetical protein [Phycisphaerales bacterium]
MPSDPSPSQQRFLWPPRPITQSGDGRSSPQNPRAAPQPASPPSWWEHVEHEWLGVTTPPLKRRLADAGAAPDPLNAFCWRCARTVGPYETDARGCAHCRDTRPPWHRFIRLAEYTHPWSGLIWDAKFTRWPRLSEDLGGLL